MENQQSEFFNTLLPQQPIPPSQTISSEPITSISQQQDILQSQPILQQQPIPQQSVTASSQIEQQPKQYRKLFFWNKLTSSIFWVFALICIWGGIANFIIGANGYGRIMLGGGMFSFFAGISFYFKKRIWYTLIPVFSFIVYGGILTFLQTLGNGITWDSAYTIPLPVIIIIGILWIVGIIFSIKQIKKTLIPFKELPKQYTSNKQQRKSGIIITLIIGFTIIGYFTIGKLCKNYPYVSQENIQNTWEDIRLPDEENGYVQLMTRLEKHYQTLNDLSNIWNEYIENNLQSQWTKKYSDYESITYTNVIHRENAKSFLQKKIALPQLIDIVQEQDFINTLYQISQQPFSNTRNILVYHNITYLVPNITYLIEALSTITLYYIETNQPELAINYNILSYNIIKAYYSMHSGREHFYSAIKMQNICKIILVYIMDTYPSLTEDFDKATINISQNNIIPQTQEEYYILKQQIITLEYLSAITTFQQEYYNKIGVGGSPLYYNTPLVGLLSYFPFFDKTSVENLTRRQFVYERYLFQGNRKIPFNLYNIIGEKISHHLFKRGGHTIKATREEALELESYWTPSWRITHGCKTPDIQIGDTIIMSCNLGDNIYPYEEYYSYEEATNICPEGYHLPTYNERKQLYENGAKLGYWSGSETPNVHFPDVRNFTEYLNLPLAGQEGTEGSIGTRGNYWSSTKKDAQNAYMLYLATTTSFRINYNINTKASVRCFKDN